MFLLENGKLFLYKTFILKQKSRNTWFLHTRQQTKVCFCSHAELWHWDASGRALLPPKRPAEQARWVLPPGLCTGAVVTRCRAGRGDLRMEPARATAAECLCTVTQASVGRPSTVTCKETPTAECIGPHVPWQSPCALPIAPVDIKALSGCQH